MRPKPRQLAFLWDEEGEPHPEPTEGSTPPVASNEPASETLTLHEGRMERVVAQENMQAAYRRVKANKGSPGVDGMTVATMKDHLRDAWPAIRTALLEGTYRPQPIRRVEIEKPDGGVRELGIPTVIDRLIQQAIAQVLEPIHDPTFSPHSYGFRPGKSAHQALEAARGYVEEGYGWVVDLDLERFFDRVNHDVLLGRLAKRIGDKRLLRLIRRYLEAGVLTNGVVIDREEGTPQGGPLSPLLSNVLLDEFDKELERRGHRFCRYADDCNVYVRTERAGQRVMESVTRFLEKRLRLRVNRQKSTVAPPRERKFLGYRIVGRTQIRLSIAPKSLKRAKERVKAITRRNRGVSLRRVLGEWGRFTDGWVAYFRLARFPSVFRDFDEWIRRRLRCYQWKQWKRPKTRGRELCKAGVDRIRAYGTAYQSGPWRASKSPGVHQALPNRKLKELGFHSLYERYRALLSE